MRLRMPGMPCEHRLVSPDCHSSVTEALPGEGEVHRNVRVAGRGPRRRLQRARGLRDLAELAIRKARIPQRLGRGAAQPSRQLQMRQGSAVEHFCGDAAVLAARHAGAQCSAR